MFQQFVGETEDLWEAHCRADFRDCEPEEFESWRELYLVSFYFSLNKFREISTAFERNLFNPLDARRRYTDFAQTSLRRRTAVNRPNGLLRRYTCGMVYSRSAPEDGIQSLFSNAYRPQHSGVIEIQTTQQLKNNCFRETQRIFMNKFCIWTPSGQRMS